MTSAVATAAARATHLQLMSCAGIRLCAHLV
jgi:hypothetical protein